jgi:hypothetical protein
MHTDDAFDFLVEYLSKRPEPEPGHRPSHNDRPYGCDVWLPWVAYGYWQQQGQPVQDSSALGEEHLRPFYDAAWDLCRIGVLRPGQIVPKGQSVGTGFVGDGYALTAFGRRWLKDAAQHPSSDPSRLAEVLSALGEHFGDGYRQRASEAVRCYRTMNYLAACVLAGAAAESILLAVATTKSGGDEAKVLAQYKTAGGRGRVLSTVLNNVGAGVADQFRNASQVLHHWRDEAAHGTATTITEVEAHTSLSQLLRLAQFTSDHWGKLTA